MRKLIFGALFVTGLALILLSGRGQATDNQSHTSTYRISPRGSGVQVGSLIFDQPAARDSAETDSLLIQFGEFTITQDPDTLVFADQGLVAYSVTPTIIGMQYIPPIAEAIRLDQGPTFYRGANKDTIFIPAPTLVQPNRILVQMWYHTELDTVGTIGKGRFFYTLIGPR